MKVDADKIEKKIMELILKGTSKGLSILRAQYSSSSIRDVESTGCGFYFNYDCSNYSGQVFKKDFRFGDIMISTNDQKYYGGVVIFTENGILDFLEIYTVESVWEASSDEISYSYENEYRDLSILDDAI